jgi:hypothetical protein
MAPRRSDRPEGGPAQAPRKRRHTIERAHIERYLALTEQALAKVRVAAPERSHHLRIARDFLDMATAYAGDARHFFEREDFVNALSCVNYAHGWLDAGARLGLFDVGGDDQLFTLAE